MLMLQVDNVWRDTPPDPAPELPEFRFSPKVTYLSRHAICNRCEQPIHEKPGQKNHWFLYDPETDLEEGPLCPTCAGHEPRQPIQGPMAHWPKPVRAKPTAQPVIVVEDDKDVILGYAYDLGKADPIWDTALRLKKFGQAAPHDKMPYGTVALFDQSSFINEQIELDWLCATQFADTPTIQAELHERGYATSSSRMTDDDEDFGNIWKSKPVIEDSDIDPNWVDPETLAARVRDIEFERWRMASGQPVRVWLEPSKINEGKATAKTNDVRLTPEQVALLGLRIQELLPDADPYDLAQAAYVAHEMKIRALDLADPETQNDWNYRTLPYELAMNYPTHNYAGDESRDDWAIEGWLKPEDDSENPKAPVELALHEVADGMALPEPHPSELWPLDYRMGMDWTLQAGHIYSWT